MVKNIVQLCTGFSSEIGTKLRDWAVGQAGGSCYSQAALSSNDSKTLYYPFVPLFILELDTIIKSHPSEGRDCFCMLIFCNILVDASFASHDKNISITLISRFIMWLVLGVLARQGTNTAALDQQNVLT